MIAIPNMEKPKDCYDCPLYDSEYPWKCELIRGDCPLIEISDDEYKAFQIYIKNICKKIEERLGK